MTLSDARERLVAIANAYLSEVDAATFVRATRPSVSLVRRPSGGTRSHLGGAAVLEPSAVWPMWDDVPLSLIAAIDLSEMPPGGTNLDLPTRGFLNFFYETERQPWGFDPREREGWRVILTQPGAGQARDAPPGAPSFPEVALEPRPALTYPSWEEDVLGDIHDRQRDALVAAQEAIDRDLGRPSPLHQLGGWPDLVQAPWQEECQLASHGLYVGNPDVYHELRADELRSGAPDWRMLAQFDTDDDLGWMWGDVGLIYYAITVQDLAARAFDRCWFVLQCT